MNACVLFLVCAIILGSANAAGKPENTNIDTLTDRYLSLENALWTIIRSGSSQQYVLQRIHDIHLIFFAEEFNEKGVYCDQMDTDQYILYSAINRINLTVATVNNRYLHANSENFRRDQTIGFAQNVKNLTLQMEKMFNVTHHKDFFKYIAEVSLESLYKQVYN